MFQIKVCGITTESDAVAAVEVGVDALGLNFYPKSPRCISRETARQIIRAIPSETVKVGLFVNEESELVKATFDALQLDFIQLHGDETREYVEQFGDRPVIKAFRLVAQNLGPIEEFCGRTGFQSDKNFRQVGNLSYGERQIGNLSYLLIDSHVEGVYGGSGVPADWTACASVAANSNLPPLILAGGLNPENVAQAIAAVRPAAVDTASGVETSPGQKDRQMMAAFVDNARRGFLGD
jgi:phosphoribosylanthranilate isomerase